MQRVRQTGMYTDRRGFLKFASLGENSGTKVTNSPLHRALVYPIHSNIRFIIILAGTFLFYGDLADISS